MSAPITAGPPPPVTASRRRRVFAWLFPRPAGGGGRVWTGFVVLYALSVLVLAVVEGSAVLTWDGEGGAIIPIATAFWTLPAGLLAFFVLISLPDPGGSELAGVLTVWGGMTLAAWIQAWVVWRLGMIGASRSTP